jgi:hypothetical protein
MRMPAGYDPFARALAAPDTVFAPPPTLPVAVSLVHFATGMTTLIAAKITIGAVGAPLGSSAMQRQYRPDNRPAFLTPGRSSGFEARAKDSWLRFDGQGLSPQPQS